jgi:hypothetical protein
MGIPKIKSLCDYFLSELAYSLPHFHSFMSVDLLSLVVMAEITSGKKVSKTACNLKGVQRV